MVDKPQFTPEQVQIKELSQAVIDALGSAPNLEMVMTILMNMTGQVIASLANGSPGAVEAIHSDVSKKMLIAARAKLILDDDLRRRQQQAVTVKPGSTTH